MSGPPHNIIQLRKVKSQRAEGKVLCDTGFHKWQVVTAAQFDVHQGKLVTVEACARCGIRRTRAI